MVTINYSAVVGLCLELLGAVLAIPCLLLGGFATDSGLNLQTTCASLGFASVPFGLLMTGVLTSIFGMSPWCLILFPSPTIACFAVTFVLVKLDLGGTSAWNVCNALTPKARQENTVAKQLVIVTAHEIRYIMVLWRWCSRDRSVPCWGLFVLERSCMCHPSTRLHL